MPKRLLPLIPAGLLVQQLLPSPDHVIIETTPGQQSAACPDCGVPSERVHSLYGRTLGDLPWQGQVVTLRVQARRFRCLAPSCPRQTFAECLTGVAPRSARRTERLGDLQRHLGLAHQRDARPEGVPIHRRHGREGGEVLIQLFVIRQRLARPGVDGQPFFDACRVRLVERAVEVGDDASLDAAELSTSHAQAVVVDLVLDATTQLFEVGGASIVSDTLALDRHWRNARTISVHNPVLYKLRSVGAHILNGEDLPYAWSAGAKK